MSDDPANSQSITGSYNAQTDGKGVANVNALNVILTPDTLSSLSDVILRRAAISTISEERTDSFASPINMIPSERNAFFTGREKVLASLYQNLLGNSTVVSPQPQAITGLGGIGKTQIAVEYAFHNQNAYEHILWINADSYETLVSNFVILTQLLHLIDRQESDPQHIRQAIKYWLHNHTGWLLIFDNVNDLSMISDFLRFGNSGHILMTTNSPITGTIAQCLEIEEMDDKEGALFLLRRAKILDLQAPLISASTEDRQTAFEIVQEMEGLPLALDQAGAYIEETRCSLADYLLLFRTRQNELLQRRGKSVTNHPDSVTTTLSLSFEKVQLANPAATDIMQMFAFLNSDAIPEDMLTQGSSVLGVILRKVASDPILLNDAIGTLLTYSLLQRNPDRTFTIHRLVQAVVKHSLSSEIQRLWVQRAINAIYLAFPKDDYRNWERCQQYIPHIQVCVKLLDQWGLILAEVADLLTEVGRYLDKSAQYEEAEAFYQCALAIREKTRGPEHPDTANTLHFLAHLYQDQGKYEQAESFHQRELAIREKTRGPEHPDTATSLRCMANLYRKQGKYKQAEAFLQRALVICEKRLGPEHPNTATTLHNLAHLYQDQGKYEQAENYHQRELAICEKTLGPEHPDTAASLHCMALLYEKQGKYEQAESFYQRALAIREKTRGPEHPNTATTLHNLANFYRMRRKYKQAEAFHQRALAIREKRLGPEHPDTAETLHFLAHLYQDQKKYEQAESYHQRELAIRETTLGPKHPDTAASLYCIAGLYHEQGKHDQAETFLQRALAIEEKTLGLEHPDTAKTLYSLAYLYQDQKKYEQAESFYQRALAIEEKTLGPEHPNTATTLHNLAHLYQDQGKYEQAENYHQRELAIREKTLGPEHPDTANSLHCMAELYQEQRKYEEAETLFQRALTIREKALGSEHPKTTLTLSKYAALLRKMQRIQEAMVLEKRVRVTRKKTSDSTE